MLVSIATNNSKELENVLNTLGINWVHSGPEFKEYEISSKDLYVHGDILTPYCTHVYSICSECNQYKKIEIMVFTLCYCSECAGNINW